MSTEEVTSSLSSDVDQVATVSYENLTKTYGSGDSEVVALKEINAKIPEKSFVSFVGPSGCGKTTMLHLTTGILEPTSGDIVINGTSVRDPDFEQHQVGLVFQQPVLLEWRTVVKNVMLPADILIENGVLDKDKSHYRERAEELLKLVGLEGFEDKYPRELSGGMQQRVSICRSLIHNPSLLLMDEPFGALDAFTREMLNKELLRIWQETEKTLLFVTHNLEEAVFLSDYVVVLSPRPGEIIDTVEIDLDRPRNEKTKMADDYHDYVDRIYAHFALE